MASLLFLALRVPASGADEKRVTGFCGAASKPAMEEAQKTLEEKTGSIVAHHCGFRPRGSEEYSSVPPRHVYFSREAARPAVEPVRGYGDGYHPCHLFFDSIESGVGGTVCLPSCRKTFMKKWTSGSGRGFFETPKLENPLYRALPACGRRKKGLDDLVLLL